MERRKKDCPAAQERDLVSRGGSRGFQAISISGCAALSRPERAEFE